MLNDLIAYKRFVGSHAHFSGKFKKGILWKSGKKPSLPDLLQASVTGLIRSLLEQNAPTFK